MNTSQKLGLKVFNYYLSKRISIGIILLVIYIVFASIKNFLASKIVLVLSVITTSSILNYINYGLLILSIVVIVVIVFISWSDYISCTFVLGENAISIKRGILNRKEVSIPYRQIQNIDIEQSMSQRMMGVSRLVILTAGNDENDTKGKSEGVFDVIDSKIAQQIKENILQKTSSPTASNIEK